ncbi:MAG: hypothetical protein ACM3MA_03575 [Acidobacteriota bacterium]
MELQATWDVRRNRQDALLPETFGSGDHLADGPARPQARCQVVDQIGLTTAAVLRYVSIQRFDWEVDFHPSS